MNSLEYSFKQKMGAVLYDLPRFLLSMRAAPVDAWIFMRNRNERLVPDDRRIGVRCDWQWTSDLHIAKIFPSLGLRLMKHAMRHGSIEMRVEPPRHADRIEVSFIIGHRGTARLPYLLTTLQAIAAQRDVSCECIVVEQSRAPEIKESLPAWVRYIHTPLRRPDLPYCRSWAFNVGARAAKGDVLVLHDNDMLVPRDYAGQIRERYREGYEAINLKRYIFYLSRSNTDRVLSSNALILDEAPGTVVQNLEAGGSVAISKKAYFEIGGFDEAFVGWGGEDNEFWERAKTRKMWPYGYLPIVHLWHEPQAGKFNDISTRKDLYWERSKEPVETRIQRLIGISSGNITGPVTEE